LPGSARSAFECEDDVASWLVREPNGAVSDVRVLGIHRPAFEAILRERPETALALMRVLCERLAPYDPAAN